MGFVAAMLEFNEARLKERGWTDALNAEHSLRAAHRDVINRLEARLRQAGADAPAAREAARALCAKYGIVTGGGGGALEKRNEVGETPLIQAAADGAARSVRCLLAAGAAVHATDTDDGRTALSWAAEMGSLECVEQLLEQGAEVEAADKEGHTSLMFSAVAGHDACLARLLEAKVRGCALHAWP